MLKLAGGGVNTVPFVGLVMLTVGSELTMIETAADVTIAPALSVAFAVRL